MKDSKKANQGETRHGALQRRVRRFSKTDLDEVVGCLRSKRKSKTLVRMGAAIDREVMGRRERGRY